ncbi:MAG: hypothetical protein ACJAZ9_001144 [Neolewinella sp.]|jgi:hypothetical protein
MKNLYFLLFAALVLFTTGCSIQDKIERREDRLLGTWEIDRAVFDEDGSLFNNNITNDFEGDLLTFLPNGQVEYLTRGGEFFVGTWFIDALRDLDDDLEFTIDADFFDGNGFLAFRWLGTISRLNENNFNLSVSEIDGTLRMKWDKV